MPVERLGPGTYVLVLRLERPERLRVGALGECDLAPGWYLYVGSALGGLHARLSRHLRAEKRLHWHIDYLLPACRVEAIWYREGRERLECVWAQSLAQTPGIRSATAGFGASDCACETHLFYCATAPHPLPDCHVMDCPLADAD